MRVAIVGSEAAKFTAITEERARALIRMFLQGATLMVSGGCHLGGIDIWAEEEADRLGIEKCIYKPTALRWSGRGGYEARNLQIANNCDICYCITVAAYPSSYTGMRFRHCYHCETNRHIKSGGCWTVKQAKRAGARGEVHVIC